MKNNRSLFMYQNSRLVDDLAFINATLNIEKLQQKARILRKEIESIDDLIRKDKESQESKLIELMSIQDNWELCNIGSITISRQLPENSYNLTLKTDQQSTLNRIWSFLINWLKSLFSYKQQAIRIGGFRNEEISLYEQSLYLDIESEHYFARWIYDNKRLFIDDEIRYINRQILNTSRLLRKVKIRIDYYKRNLRRIIRMIHQYLYRGSDDVYELTIN